MPNFRKVPNAHVRLLLARPMIGLGRVVKAASTGSLPRYRFAAGHGARAATRLSASAAALTALRTMRDVPAYADFVAVHGGAGSLKDAAAWIARLPITDKHS